MVLGAIVGTVASNPMASMDQAMELATFTHELYLNATCRKLQLLIKEKTQYNNIIVNVYTAPVPTPCDQGQRGCCPYIVRPGPKGSVIQAFTGYRGNAAIIVDWGSPWNQNCDWRRNCTVSDIGFM